MAWKFYTALGAEKASTGSITDRGTSLPGSPYDGQEYSLVVDASAGVVWRFKYNAGSGSALKWECVGAPSPLASVVYTGEGTATASSWVDLATVGPSVTLPRAGDYRIAAGINISNFGGAAASAYFSVFKNNVTQLSPSGTFTTSAAGQGTTGSMEDTVTGLAAADVLKLKYQGSVGTNFTWANRWIRVTPIRVS